MMPMTIYCRPIKLVLAIITIKLILTAVFFSSGGAEQFGVGMIHMCSLAIWKEELMLSPQLREEQYSLYKAHTCQQFRAGLMQTLTILARLQEPQVGDRFICGHWARTSVFFYTRDLPLWFFQFEQTWLVLYLGLLVYNNLLLLGRVTFLAV